MDVNEEDPHHVYLNVHHDSSLNRPFLHRLGIHFYLTSIRVHGHEYTFDKETGIVLGDPSALTWHQGQRFHGSFPMGRTQLDPDQVLELATITLANDFTNHNHNSFTHNCNHYSDRLCRELTGQRIPSWVNRSAKFGRFLQCVMHADRRIDISADDDRRDETSEEQVEGDQGVRVYLYVYDVNAVASPLMRLLGIGLYRSFVQVGGRDYTFRPRLGDGDYLGITSGREWCHGLRLHERILIGHTNSSEIGISTMVQNLEREFATKPYRHFTNNCHHFSDRLCRELTGNGIPSWVNGISTLPLTICSCFLPDPDPQQGGVPIN